MSRPRCILGEIVLGPRVARLYEPLMDWSVGPCLVIIVIVVIVLVVVVVVVFVVVVVVVVVVIFVIFVVICLVLDFDANCVLRSRVWAYDFILRLCYVLFGVCHLDGLKDGK